ncbi:preflagellin peptidase FlaK [Natronoarchaeum philippinense]|uniref:Preflagellin peptidase FlaK n=1 Tax=Natronoarchaeum philippinense TaxID=558529 RepID=A0A285PBV9_NATPI|nr:A24 family peptidase [Natronoarchaeum philippinense]SNZ17616.1 preflagellin peptidase FlaK [Natronoarchaeum philippinense]
MIDLGLVLAPASDLLRLLAVPVFGWAAWRDVKIRRVPNATWLPLLALAVLALGLQALDLSATGGYVWRRFLSQVAISVGLVVPLAYIFWRIGGFGGADAKALMVLAVLFPAFPSYFLLGGSQEFPIVQTTVGVFSFTVLTNAVIVAAAYPVALVLYNAARRRFTSAMAVGLERPWTAVASAHGQLLERPDGLTRRGLDLDALRMYLRWRGLSLSELRERPDYYRDPDTLPEEPNPPTDGAVLSDDPATAVGVDADATPADAEPGETDGGAHRPDADYEDPWGAAAFLAAIDGSAYGTTPEGLRDGLDVLATEDTVWISPGIPFIVPLFAGLVVALVYGDVLFTILRFIGLV